MTTCEERSTGPKAPPGWGTQTFIHSIAEVNSDADDVTFLDGVVATACGRVRERVHAAFSATLPVMYHVRHHSLVDLRVLPRVAPPAVPRVPIHIAAQLGDVIEQMAKLLHRAAWCQAHLSVHTMLPFESLPPAVRETFRRAATVAVRKLCVHQMAVAESDTAPLFPCVNVRDVIEIFDRALAQEWV
jgi:hypothetical protein